MKRWPTKPLGELILPTEQRDPRANPLDEFSYVDIASVDNQTKRIIATKRIVGAEAPRRARKVIRGGDILVSTVRPNLNAVALVPGNLDSQICSTGFSVLRPSKEVLSGYMFAFVRSPIFVDYLVAKTTGANYPAVNDGEVKDVPVPVPPLAEQERIVKLLDEADELRKLRAAADRRTAALIPALFHEMFGDPIEGNGLWPIVKMESIAAQEKYSIVDGPFGSSIKQEDYKPTGVPIIRIKNISAEGRFIDRDFLYINNDKYDDLKRSAVQEGDILISRVGTLGNSCIYPGIHAKALLSTTGVCKIAPNEKIVDRLFLHRLILMPEFQQQIKKSASSAVQSYFNLTALRNWKLILPPLPLQKEFAQRVSEIRELQAAQAASRQQGEHLFQSMLHRAFNQEL